MTGATLIAVKGTHAAMVKVRTDGYDVLERLPTIPLAPGDDPKAALLKYLDQRLAEHSAISMGSQLDLNLKREVFELMLTKKWRTKSQLWDLTEDAAYEAFEALEAKGDSTWEDYRCSYSDYEVLVDCDAGKYYLMSGGRAQDLLAVASREAKEEAAHARRMEKEGLAAMKADPNRMLDPDGMDIISARSALVVAILPDGTFYTAPGHPDTALAFGYLPTDKPEKMLGGKLLGARWAVRNICALDYLSRHVIKQAALVPDATAFNPKSMALRQIPISIFDESAFSCIDMRTWQKTSTMTDAMKDRQLNDPKARARFKEHYPDIYEEYWEKNDQETLEVE